MQGETTQQLLPSSISLQHIIDSKPGSSHSQQILVLQATSHSTATTPSISEPATQPSLYY